MTAAALRRRAVRTVEQVGVDLLRVALRQHRMLIIATTVACGALAAYLLTWNNATSPYGIDDIELVSRYDVIAFSFVAAAFWGAPLLSREYEQRTHLLVWSQDVAATRWLLTKIALLGGVVVVLAAGLERADDVVFDRVDALMRWDGVFGLTYLPGFESNVLVQVGYALAAFAIGVAVGGLTRIPVVAMVASGLMFLLIRWFVATWIRDLYPSNVVVEFAIYAVLAAFCLTFAWFGVRRRQHV